MPSRSVRCLPFALVATLMAGAVLPSFAQQLELPTDLSSLGTGTTGQPAMLTPSSTPATASPGLTGSLGMDAVPMHVGPTTEFATGSVYNPSLGAHLRARYNTRSYGQQEGTLDLGTMKMLDWDGGVLFLDGQVTMNDDSGVGYNLGAGYRWVTLPMFPFSPDDEKIMGASIWSDGQTIGKENFFNQIGVSFEMLGEHIDFRANGYAPVGPRTRTRDGVATGELTFSANSLAQQLQLVRDTALTVGEAELAGRLGGLDAWAFAGVYGFNGGQYDGVGGKVGLRGYATPDLLLSIAIANDDEFDTNALFSATWFIGRTRAENCPTGTLRDRMREPVLRNNYIATQQDTVLAAGEPILQVGGEELRIVHVDSTAAAGGDGSFENPLNSLDDINANSLDNDIVLAHGGSDFNDQTATLRNGQTFVGEGGGNAFSVSLEGFGTVELPETATGALAGAIPTIAGAAGTSGVVLGDDNTVQNLAFDGGLNAITNGVTGSHNANLNNLTIGGTTGDGIALTAIARTDVTDIDNDNDMTDMVNALGTITISDVDFDGITGNDIDINADTGVLDNADIVSEAITISNITSVNNTTAQSIAIRNTSAGGTANVNDLDYNGGFGAVLVDGGAGTVTVDGATIDGATDRGITVSGGTAATTLANVTYNGGVIGTGAVLIDSTDGQITFRDSVLTGGNTPAIEVRDTTGGVSVASSVEINNVNGEAVLVTGAQSDGTSAVAMNAVILNDSVDGGGVRVVNNTANVSFGSDITTQNANAVTIQDSQANVTFAGNLDANGTGTAITINNAGVGTTNNAEVVFNGTVDNEAGTLLAVSGGDDAVQFTADVTDTGDGISITGRQSGASVTFESTAAVSLTGAADAITLGGAGALANADDSSVTIDGDLTIAGATRGITGTNFGELNITGSTPTNNNTLASTDTAISLTDGSSTGGVNFSSVTNTGGAGAVVLTRFDGTVDIEGGSLVSDVGNTAVQVTDSSLDLDGVDINSGSTTAVQALFNGTTNNRTLRVANGNVNGDDIVVTTSGTTGSASDAIVTLDTLANLRNTDLNVNGAGNLTTTMTGITGSGAGNTTLDVTDDGDGSLTINTSDAIGNVTATASNTAGGDVLLSIANSGNTTALGAITVDDQGDGAATGSFTNVTSTAGIDFGSTDNGNASLTVSGGSYAADINAVATNNGTFTANVIGNTTMSAGNVNIDAQNTGTLNSTLTGVDTPGTITVAANNNVTNATINVSGGDNTGVTVTADNTGTLTTNVNNVTTTGALLVDATNGGNATIGITGGGFDDGMVVNANNTGTIDYTMTGVSFDTADAITAVDLNFGTGITSGDVLIENNSGITTLDGSALDVAFLGGSGGIQFELNNNTFTNNSGTAETVSVTASGTSVIDATVTTNNATNANVAAAVEYLIETLAAGSPTMNLNISGNTATTAGGGAGSGDILIRESGGTFSVFELDDTFNNTGTRNNATVTFDPNNQADFDDLPNAPATP